MKHPIWLENMLWYLRSGPPVTRAEEVAAIEGIFGRLCLQWLDRTHVRGSKKAYRAARVMLRRLELFADFTLIASKFPVTSRCQKRLRGIGVMV